MNNVYNLKSKKLHSVKPVEASDSDYDEDDFDDAEYEPAPRKDLSTAGKVAYFIFNVVRWPVFLLMYWVRGPIVFLCGLISLPMLLLFLFSYFAFPERTWAVWGFGTVSFLAFSASYFYDFILRLIAPEQMIASL